MKMKYFAHWFSVPTQQLKYVYTLTDLLVILLEGYVSSLGLNLVSGNELELV